MSKQNFRIRIADYSIETNVLSFDLKEILQTIFPLVENLVWSVHDVKEYGEYLDVVGPASEVFEKTRDRHSSLAGKELLELAISTTQCIWAEFHGRKSGTKNQPSVTIRAVDSSFWEIETEDFEIVRLLENRFLGTKVVKLTT